MNKQEVAKLVKKRVQEMGVPDHLFTVKPVPARVELNIAVGGSHVTMKLRTGITQMELDEKMAALASKLNERDGTIDLEEAIAAKEIV